MPQYVCAIKRVHSQNGLLSLCTLQGLEQLINKLYDTYTRFCVKDTKSSKLSQTMEDKPRKEKNVSQLEDNKLGSANMSALLSNDSSAENCNKPNNVDSQKHNLDEESLITSHYSGAQEFSATPISPQSTTTTSMSASGKFFC